MEFDVKGSDERLEIGIRYLPHYEGLEPVSRMTSGSSGYDIVAACRDEITIQPGRTVAVPAGFELSIPVGYEAQVRPRSGLALKCRIGLLNSPGTVDSDYRGEVRVILYNFGEQDYIVRRGDRIAQLVFCRLPAVRLVERVELDRTDRGSGGFGHTG
ncbi:MAG: dUTP diphosphatase [bacterium]|nr:MAG: dUTP diphosphatase [bacterium]